MTGTRPRRRRPARGIWWPTEAAQRVNPRNSARWWLTSAGAHVLNHDAPGGTR